MVLSIGCKDKDREEDNGIGKKSEILCPEY